MSTLDLLLVLLWVVPHFNIFEDDPEKNLPVGEETGDERSEKASCKHHTCHGGALPIITAHQVPLELNIRSMGKIHAITKQCPS